MYEENKENSSVQQQNNKASADCDADNQAIKTAQEDPQMESISFMDYESYKTKYLQKESQESDVNSQSNISESVFPSENQSISQGQPVPMTQNNPQNQFLNGDHNLSSNNPTDYSHNYSQNKYECQDQNSPQHRPPYNSQNISPNQYPYSNQNFFQGQHTLNPQYPPQNQYTYGNQDFHPEHPPYYPQNYPQNQNPYNNNYSYRQQPYNQQHIPQHQNPNINSGVPPLQPPLGYPTNPQNQYPYGNNNVSANQLQGRYPNGPFPAPQYRYPNVPPNQYPYINQNNFRQVNPYRPYQRPMTKDEYTLGEIRKSYNRTGLTLFIHTFGIIIIQIILALVFAFSAFKSGTDVLKLFTSSDIEVQYAFTVVLSYALTNVGCALIGLAFTKRVNEFTSIFKIPKMNLKSVLWAFLSIYGLQGIIHILHTLYFSLEINQSPASDPSIGDVNPDVIIVYIIYSVILAPITEEILFRGMVLKNLSVVNKKFAIIFSAVLFGLFHENFPQMITATLIGILLAYVAIKSNSILIPIGLHMLNNLSMEIIDAVPDSTPKNIVLLVLFFGAGVFGLIMFIRSMKGSYTPNDTYSCLYEFDDPSYEKKASFGSVLASPAMDIFLVIFTLIIVVDIYVTIVH